jgi:hypothetical protein
VTGAPRTSRDGHPCPPWCETDHGVYVTHWKHNPAIGVPGALKSLPDEICTSAIRNPEMDAPAVRVHATRYGRDDDAPPDLWLTPGDAEHLACIIEMLATATTRQRRDLAAAIRVAATAISGLTRPRHTALRPAVIAEPTVAPDYKAEAERAGVAPKFCGPCGTYYWHCWTECPDDHPGVPAMPGGAR